MWSEAELSMCGDCELPAYVNSQRLQVSPHPGFWFMAESDVNSQGCALQSFSLFWKDIRWLFIGASYFSGF